ncbi:MAG: alpha/beta hydrolase fold domain-containing protein [Pseudomonadota bacterium]
MSYSPRFWQKIRCALGALGLAALSACSGGSSSGADDDTAQGTPPNTSFNTSSQTDIVYGSGLVVNSAVNLALDIYQPAGACTEPRPFVIGIHGGGFTGGSKSGASWVANMEGVVARGFVGISINYRLVGDQPLVSAEFQPLLDDLNTLADMLGASDAEKDQLNAAVAAFEDTVAALDWARENAVTRCLDMDRFALWGSSAGAITALHVAHALDEYFIDRPDPLVVVDYWGRLFLDDLVDTNGPPIMIIHGTNDTTVTYDNALSIAAEAATAGLPYTFYTIQDGPHGFGSINPNSVTINGDTALNVALDFIEAHLTDGTPLYEVQTIVPD